MKRFLASIFVMLAAWPANVAVAQETHAPLGSRILRPIEMESAEKNASIRITHGMTECLARSQPVQWSGVLATVPGTSQERELFRTLASKAGDCLIRGSNGMASRVVLAFQPAVVRGPLSESLMERHFSGKAIRRPTLAQPFPFKDAVALPDMSANTRTSLVALEFGDCVYRAAPQAAASLFATGPASSEEKAAVAALGPHLGPCLPAGVTLTFNSLMLRGALAEAAYRYAATAAVPTSTGAQN